MHINTPPQYQRSVSPDPISKWEPLSQMYSEVSSSASSPQSDPLSPELMDALEGKQPHDLTEPQAETELLMKDFSKTSSPTATPQDNSPSVELIEKIATRTLQHSSLSPSEEKSDEVSGAKRGKPNAMFKQAKLYLNGDVIEKDPEKVFHLFLKAAQAGSVPANAYVAACYQSGIGVPIDQQVAVEWLKKGAEGEDPLAMNNLGWCFYTGYGVQKNIDTAIALFTKASQKNNAARCNLGFCYYQGIGVPLNIEEARKLYLKASGLHYPPAMNLLGIWYLTQGENYKKKGHRDGRYFCVKWFRNGALAEDPSSIYNLALCYRYGFPNSLDLPNSSELLLKVTDKDRVKPNQFFPGTSLLIKEASRRCTLDEIRWGAKKVIPRHARVTSPSPHLAASQSVLSSTGSQPGLDSGLPQEEKLGFEVETAQVIRYAIETKNNAAVVALAISGQAGHVPDKECFLSVKRNLKGFALTGLSQLKQLGMRFLYGKDVEKTPVNAFILFSAGAELGDADCMNALGCCYSDGTDVKKNIRKAIELFTKSADEGNPAALCNLGYCYQHAIAGRVRLRKATMLFLRAAHLHYPPAMNLLGLSRLIGTGHSRFSVYQRDKTRLQNAFDWFLQGAEAGDSSSMHNLGSCYYFGIGVEQNLQKATELYAKAADRDRAKLDQLFLSTDPLLPGVSYRYTADDLNARPQQSARKEDQSHFDFIDVSSTFPTLPEASSSVTAPPDNPSSATLVEESAGGAVPIQPHHLTDPLSAMELLIPAFSIESLSNTATPSDPASFALTEEIATGTVPNFDLIPPEERSYAIATPSFLPAAQPGADRASADLPHSLAEAGDPAAMITILSSEANLDNTERLVKLGQCYEKGTGVTKDPEKAFEYISKAVEAGDTEAIYILGIYYQQGVGVEKDVCMADKLFHREASAPDRNIEGLAEDFLKGINCEKNSRKAFYLFYAAAERGDADAMFNLAKLYLNGDGVEKDAAKAFSYFLQAAQAGCIPAMAYVAACYQSGIGVPIDLQVAVEWFKKGIALTSPSQIK